ncbi:hypothetical protein SAMN04487995_0939 [Dyadobacter koreensis]|uniref:Uncharacterized protein n=1 Tax=Dyadobacter koreensis TaxID=408657 RepID=A0A1H6QRM7_9BACT|nr:hypothetical protein SAMN04487995_0939 [Dyadobacter koreensis]
MQTLAGISLITCKPRNAGTKLAGLNSYNMNKASKRIVKFDKKVKKQIKRFEADMRNIRMTDGEWNRLHSIRDHRKQLREEIFELLYLP